MKRSLLILFRFALSGCFILVPASHAQSRDGSSTFRTMQYTSRSQKEAIQWQYELRSKLFALLRMSDLIAAHASIPLEPKWIRSEKREDYTWQEWAIRSTPTRMGRTMNIVITIPHGPTPPYPAVVCISGHGGNRYVVYDTQGIYHGFAEELAKKNYVTISCDVAQHEVYERNRTLMGERLWDTIRCVDYLHSLPFVDKGRIGCAGLSLGGEMTMWLGAMDPRVAAVVSSGFLTVMDQMEHNHCMCWKFEGLRELVDFADLYSMIAPRPLQCQNGLKEDATMFTVSLARQALEEIQIAYQDFAMLNRLELDVHEGAHEIDLPALMNFFDTYVKNPKSPIHTPDPQ